MDLRSLPPDLSSEQRVTARRRLIEQELGIDLSLLEADEQHIGQADEKNCEQMFGIVSVPVGYAGPLAVQFSSGEESSLHLPLATTEGALVASVNRGCKALTQSGGVRTSSIHHGTNRSIAFRSVDPRSAIRLITRHKDEWTKIGEATSSHLKILTFDLDEEEEFVFLTIFCDTGEAMGMNMVTIAAQAIGEWIGNDMKIAEFITVAGNVDSDKKPSLRTIQRGRGYEVTAEATLAHAVMQESLKSSAETMIAVANAKLIAGSDVAGMLGRNLHVANIIAALYLATGQDVAHTVEGSMATTGVELTDEGLKVYVRLPALLVGIRGGGTALPTQQQCLHLLLKSPTSLSPTQQLAESIGAAVLAGEISLLAAQASHTLAKAHKEHGR